MPVSPPLVLDRVLVAAAIALTGIVFLTSTADPVNIPKLTVLLLCAAPLIGLALARAVRSRTVELPWGLPALAGVALALGFVVAAAVAPQASTAVNGTVGRNSGLLAYGAALILYLTVLRTFDRGSTVFIAFGLLAAGLFTASYGVLQLLGIDAIRWSNPFNPVIATLGNPDFASAYLGITAPVAVWAACWTAWSRFWRITSGVVAATCLGVAVLSEAVQGPIAAGAGLAVVALALALDLSGSRRRTALSVIGALGALAVAGIGLGRLGIGPAKPFFTGLSADTRLWFWEAAVKMWLRAPLTGVGLDSYGLYWRRDRPLGYPRRLGGDGYSDSAHSVPLQHLAQGGLLLAGAYLLFLVVVLAALVRGMRRLAGQERLLLAGLGGAWVAYQVQSIVSIDQVPLLVVNYVLGAAVVVASGTARVRVVRLPGALVDVPPARGRKVRVPKVRPLTGLDVGLLGGTAVLTLTLLWLSLTPLRASYAARVGDLALAAREGTPAAEAFGRAIELNPGVGAYRTRLGQTFEAGGRLPEARAAFEVAFEVDEAEINAGRTAAVLAEEQGDLDTARRIFERALALDPSNGATIREWAKFTVEHGDATRVRDRLQRAVRDLPDDSGLWAWLGEARAALDDREGALAAYREALRLLPSDPVATKGLAELTGG